MAKLKTIVIGAGFAGLSAAHELAKSGVEVVLVERDSAIGGIAQSREAPLEGSPGKQLVCEFGWRGWGTNYHHVRKLAREIPCHCDSPWVPPGTPKPASHTVIDHLVPTSGLAFSNSHSPLIVVPFKNKAETGRLQAFRRILHGMRWSEALLLLGTAAYSLVHSEERLHAKHSGRWADWIGAERRSFAFNQLFVDGLWTIFGISELNASTEAGLSSIERILAYMGTGRDMSIAASNTPTQHTWFVPWRAWLEERGVQILCDAQAERLHLDASNRISGVTVRDTRSGAERDLAADAFVLAMPVDALSALCRRSGLPDDTLLRQDEHLFEEPLRLSDPADPRMTDAICEKTSNVMVHFDRPLPEIPYSTFIADAPWMFAIQPLRSIYPPEVYERYAPGGGDAREVCYLSFCVRRPGILHPKTAFDMTEPEFIEEVNRQIEQSSFSRLFTSPPRITRIWQFPNWREHTKMGNAAGFRGWQLQNDTRIANLYAAGCYIGVSFIPYCTETAAQSGMHAAWRILEQQAADRRAPTESAMEKLQGRYECALCRTSEDRPLSTVLAPVRALDRWLFRRGWRSPIDVLIGS